MTKNNEKQQIPPRSSALIRVCPEFNQLVKDVQIKTCVQSTAQATKVIYNGMIFDTNLATIFQKKKV
jgi:hypothetical protein